MAHVIGLTGGIASGKSSVARLLVAKGAAIVDADQVARQVVEPGQPALGELVARFGATILAPDGTLDRKRLGAIAFADPAARADLGRITHPRIAAASAKAIAAYTDAGAEVVFYEAPLLVENKIHTTMADTIVVSASAEVQIARTMARDGLAEEAARARVASQLPLADKIAVATWVIENHGDPAALAAEVDRVVALIEAKYGPIRIPKRVAAEVATPTRRREVALVTGFPAFTAKRMIAKLGEREPETKLFVLAREKFAAEAQELAAKHGNAEVLVGDVCDMDLGLSSAEYRALCGEVTWIHHLAGIYFMGVDDDTARAVNVKGTRAVLDIAAAADKLQRVVHWSTAMVSGDRGGTVFEEDLEAGQRFKNAYERTKYEAEKLARAAARRMPVTILRPSIIVGDTATGEIDKLDGPYYLMVLIATNTSNVRLPMLGRGDHPLHLVPIDYVAEAAWRIARSERAAGRTFHLVDPHPMTLRAVLDAVADLAGTQKPGATHIPKSLARAVLRTPGLSKLGRGPLAFMDVLDRSVHYDAQNTADALAGSGVQCPPLADYLPVLVRAILDTRAARPS